MAIGLGCLGALWAVGYFLRSYGGQALRSEAGPDPVTAWLIALAGVAALVLAAFALAGPVARRYGRSRRPVALVAAALALMAEPVRAAIGLGHLDLLLFGLVTADVVALRRSAWARRRAAWWPGPAASRPPRGRLGTLRRCWSTGTWAGAGIGVASALAFTPMLFILYLVVTRRWRPALIAAGTAAALRLTALPAGSPGPVPIDGESPIGDPANQSLAGLLARLYDSSSTPVLVWLSFAALLLAVGLIRARAAHADGDEIAAFTLVGLTGAAIAPVTSGHELIWMLPAVLILVDAAARLRASRRRRRPRRPTGLGYAGAALAIYLIMAAPPEWTVSWNAYAFTVILLMNALPWRPGVVPAIRPVRRPVEPARVPAIPGPRGS
ncbi:glycosyltransferase 87 family protein [Actinoplanes sp. M2I2]|uniref:glycosyltransferase 87 family protein n=1 Tax=Actinoplanes sp. M2I2 TaxID=1734444 RepID=UPI0020218E29|nr:glycosyltransferase 87 family protein [Actinoplanes sp. M2I2]